MFTRDFTGSRVLSDMSSGWETWDVQPSLADEGFDSCTIVLAKDYRSASMSGSMLASEFPVGRAIGGNMWVQRVRGRRHNAGIWIAEVQTMGAYNLARGQKIRICAGVNQQSADKVSGVPGLNGVLPHLQTLEAVPEVECGYLSMAAPQTARIGTTGAPPFAPAVRPSSWTTISDPTFHYPSGWVMVDMRADQLVGVNVWWITEVWRWINRVTP